MTVSSKNDEKKRKKKRKKKNKKKDKKKDKDEDEVSDDDVELTTTVGDKEGDDRNEFPRPFYCPITKQVMEDPVVKSDGVSYERSAVASMGDEKMYENRALKTVIDDAVAASGTSVRAVALRIQHSMRKVYNEAIENSLIPSKEYRPLPDVYYCPITFSLIHDPVIDPEGTTYEKVAIVKWIQENGTSPLTRTELSIEDLFPNRAIEELLNIEKTRDESSIDPSIRKFKNEEAPKMDSNIDVETGDAIGADFPTNHEELTESERRRNARAAKKFTCFALMITIALIVLAMIGFPLPFICYIFCICFFCCPKSNTN